MAGAGGRLQTNGTPQKSVDAYPMMDSAGNVFGAMYITGKRVVHCYSARVAKKTNFQTICYCASCGSSDALVVASGKNKTVNLKCKCIVAPVKPCSACRDRQVHMLKRAHPTADCVISCLCPRSTDPRKTVCETKAGRQHTDEQFLVFVALALACIKECDERSINGELNTLPQLPLHDECSTNAQLNVLLQQQPFHPELQQLVDFKRLPLQPLSVQPQLRLQLEDAANVPSLWTSPQPTSDAPLFVPQEERNSGAERSGQQSPPGCVFGPIGTSTQAHRYVPDSSGAQEAVFQGHPWVPALSTAPEELYESPLALYGLLESPHLLEQVQPLEYERLLEQIRTLKLEREQERQANEELQAELSRLRADAPPAPPRVVTRDGMLAIYFRQEHENVLQGCGFVGFSVTLGNGRFYGNVIEGCCEDMPGRYALDFRDRDHLFHCWSCSTALRDHRAAVYDGGPRDGEVLVAVLTLKTPGKEACLHVQHVYRGDRTPWLPGTTASACDGQHQNFGGQGGGQGGTGGGGNGSSAGGHWQFNGADLADQQGSSNGGRFAGSKRRKGGPTGQAQSLDEEDLNPQDEQGSEASADLHVAARVASAAAVDVAATPADTVDAASAATQPVTAEAVTDPAEAVEAAAAEATAAEATAQATAAEATALAAAAEAAAAEAAAAEAAVRRPQEDIATVFRESPESCLNPLPYEHESLELRSSSFTFPAYGIRIDANSHAPRQRGKMKLREPYSAGTAAAAPTYDVNSVTDCRLGLSILSEFGEEGAAQAAEFLHKAAKAGHTAAQAELGELYRTGRGVPPDADQAHSWLLLAAGKGSAAACRALGLLCHDEGNHDGALRWLLAAVDHRDATAPDLIVKLFVEATDMEEEREDALESICYAAADGDAASQYALGAAHAAGLLVKQDHAAAKRWFNNAAAQGHAAAQNNVGYRYHHGGVLGQNFAAALRWYKKAAAQGHLAAHHNIGFLHEHGQGVPQDYRAAMAWYRRAAEEGYANAQFAIGDLFRSTLGKVDSSALQWFLKAAVQGHTAAQYHAGLFFEHDNGTGQDYTAALRWYLEAASHGDAGAQYNAACLYEQGLGVDEDRDAAMHWFSEAAEQGYAPAQYSVGCLYDADQDYATALEWYHMAAAQGNVDAQFAIGYLHDHGCGVEQNYATALEWYREAAAQGDANAQFAIGYLYGHGQGVQQDHATALKWYHKAAAQGDVDAQYAIGDLYDDGWGVERNYTTALQWYRQAAHQGHDVAQHAIGHLFQYGKGVRLDTATALVWYLKAAYQGHAVAQYDAACLYQHEADHANALQWLSRAAALGYAPAQFSLGYVYEHGHGVQQDYATALEWYSKAAAQGYVAALNNGGYLYQHGRGVQADLATAREWYLRAANQGHAPAQYNVGYLFEHGLGVQPDDTAALEWYHKAADQGHAEAQYCLGCLYECGRGVPEYDYDAALEWYLKAEQQGHADASGARTELLRQRGIDIFDNLLVQMQEEGEEDEEETQVSVLLCNAAA